MPPIPVQPDNDGAVGAGSASETDVLLQQAAQAARAALDRLEAIHDGRTPYRSDKAFTVDEAADLRQLATVALELGDVPAVAIFEQVLRLTSVAPGTAATLPSQSLSIALANAIGDAPMPRAVAALRATLPVIRHAGIAKKLGRILARAERRMVRRRDFPASLLPGQKISAAVLRQVSRSVEASWLDAAPFTAMQWQTLYGAMAPVSDLVSRFIWNVTRADGTGITALPQRKDQNWHWLSAEAGPVVMHADDRIRLWHPVEADAAERDAWRARIITAGLEQPFAQVFRTWYRPEESELDGWETALFAGHRIALRPFLGLALKTGWEGAGESGIQRRERNLLFCFDAGGPTYPGAAGEAVTGTFSVSQVFAEDVKTPLPLAQVGSVLLSEILRSVDLMVSVAGLADAPAVLPFPDGGSGAMRREILRRVYADAADVSVDGNHLLVCGHRVHMGTGRVTRDGDPVPVDTAAASGNATLAWLPRDDAMLDMILRTVHALR